MVGNMHRGSIVQLNKQALPLDDVLLAETHRLFKITDFHDGLATLEVVTHGKSSTLIVLGVSKAHLSPVTVHSPTDFQKTI